jgi:hypothetical protein
MMIWVSLSHPSRVVGWSPCALLSMGCSRRYSCALWYCLLARTVTFHFGEIVLN